MSQRTINDLKKNDKISVFYVSPIATTVKVEFVVYKIQSLPGEPVELIVTIRGQRKKRKYSAQPEHIVLPGHDLPVKSDMDFDHFQGNAQLNLVAESKKIALETLSQSLTPLTHYHKSHLLLFTPQEAQSGTFGEGEKLYDNEEEEN